MCQKKIRKIAVLILIAALGATAAFLAYELIEAKERAAKEVGPWARLIQTLRSTNTGFFEVKSGDTKFNFASVEAHEIFGYAAGEMEQMPLDAIMPETMAYDHERKMLDSMSKAHAHVHQGPKVIPVECKARHKDGHEFDIVLRIMLGDEYVQVFVNKASEAKFLPMGKYPNTQTPADPNSFPK
jgi:PAS domain-containing protein